MWILPDLISPMTDAFNPNRLSNWEFKMIGSDELYSFSITKVKLNRLG
jgi:hypothetical protein